MKVNETDFRLLPNESPIDSVNKIKQLKTKIEANGHIITNYHAFLDDKKYDEYRMEFAHAFSNRCCYCGDSFSETLNYLNLQIDHIISKSTGLNGINNLENLTPSCQNCNNGKKDSIKTEAEEKLVHPSTLNKVFERRGDLYIVIRDEYKDNATIQDFYSKTGLRREIHRINYILLYLSYLKKKYSADDTMFCAVTKVYDKIKNSIDGWMRVNK